TGNWNNSLSVDFYGVPIQTAQAHLKLLQGHLPAAHTSSATSIDIMLTSSAALYLGHFKVGDTVTVTSRLLTGERDYSSGYEDQISAHVVGIFQVLPNDEYWNGYTLEEPPPIAGTPPPAVLALTDQASLLHMLDAINQEHQGDGIYFSDRSINSLLLSYDINSATLVSSQLTDLIGRLGTLQQDIVKSFQQELVFGGGNNIAGANLFGSPVRDPI